MTEEEFRVRSTDGGGGPAEETVKAESVEALVDRLRSEGMQASEVTGRRGRRLFEPRGCSPEAFATFNTELAAACQAGAPLPDALRAFSLDLPNRRMTDVLDQVAAEVEDGGDLADALAKRTEFFPPAYVALVHAGLQANDLSRTLLIIAQEARFSARVRHQIVSAVVYPLFVLFAVSMLLSLCGWVVLPGFIQMFKEMGVMGNLPAITGVFVSLAPVLRWAPAILLLGLSLTPLLLRVLGRRASTAPALGALVLKIPILGRYLHGVALSRFCRTFSSALAGNVATPEALTLAGAAAGNASFQVAAEDVREKIVEGRSLSDGMEEANPFPASLAWMISLGEKRDELQPVLEEYAELQEQKIQRLGEVLPLIASATVTLFAAWVMGVSAIAMFQPLIQLMNQMGGM